MTIAQKIAKTADPIIIFSRIGSTQHETKTGSYTTPNNELGARSNIHRTSQVHYIFKDGSEIIDRQTDYKGGETERQLLYRNKPSSNNNARSYKIYF